MINHYLKMIKLFIYTFIIINYSLALVQVNVKYEWKFLDYKWISKEHKNKTISEGKYNHELIFTIDVEEYKGRLFVTTPAYNPNAVPASLSTVSDKIGPGGPLLDPYPNWNWHNSTSCNGMISVWRVAVDDCDRLWVLDSGKISDEQVCPAQLLVFDLGTDQLLKRIIIPDEISHNPHNKSLGLLVTPVVETEGTNCSQTWVYIADTEGGGLIIYDGTYLWRLNDDVFKPDPIASDFKIADESFNLPDGLLGLAVTPRESSLCRRLFFRPLASLNIYYFSTEILHRSRNSINNGVRYTTYNYRLPSQVAAMTFSPDGTLLFGLSTEIAIACWNQFTPMDNKHVVMVAQNNTTLQWASGVKVSKYSMHRLNPKLWLMTNRFQKIASGTQNFGEINYRINTVSVAELIQGSECQWHTGNTLSLLNMLISPLLGQCT